MELIDRYIYAVTQRLPEQQREDIKQELQGLIEDMLDERLQSDRPTREDAESVLLELGHPNTLAAKYRGYDRYLIGPSLFDSYLTTLKIVLISVLVAMCAVFVIESIFTPTGILEHFTGFWVSLFTAGAQGFGWVTVIFAVIEYRKHGKAGERGEKKPDWKPSELPDIPNANSRIKLSEPIAGIIFTVLFMVLVLYSIDLIGVWRIQDGGHTIIPIFNEKAVLKYIPIVSILAALGILRESIKILVRKRTGQLLALHVSVSVVSAILGCIVLADPAIWNPDFIQQLKAAEILTAGGKDYDTVVSIWNGVTGWIVQIVVLFTLIDIISETYKWHRAKPSA